MEIFTLSKRDKKQIFDMASGRKEIDVKKLGKVSKRFSKVFPDAIGMAEQYPENKAYSDNVKELKELKLLIQLLLNYQKSERDFNNESSESQED